MKRLFALLLTVTLALSLTACGRQAPSVQVELSLPSETATVATTTPSPTPLDEVATEAPQSVSDNPYRALEDTIEAETEAVLSALDVEWETLASSVDNYATYMANAAEIERFYEKVYDVSAALCVQMREFSIEYAKAVLASGRSTDDMYEDLEEIYDLIYDDMGDEIYDGIYDGVLDNMYDGLYSGALDDVPDDVAYSDWSDARSDEYRMWSDMRSDTYSQWSDFRSDVYGFWSDMRREVYGEDLEGAQEEIADFAEDTKKLSDKLTPVAEAASAEEAQPEAAPDSTTPAGGIRPEFKEAMDSYEVFFDEYVEFMKAYSESTDISGMSDEYFSMMQQYLETMSALQEIDEAELSEEEGLYYAEVMLRISQKLMEVA